MQVKSDSVKGLKIVRNPLGDYLLVMSKEKLVKLLKVLERKIIS